MSSEVFNRNLEALLQFHPELGYFQNFTPSPEVQPEPAANGMQTLRFVTGSSKIYVHSRYNPANEPEFPPLLSDCHVVLFGAGLGYRLTKLNLPPMGRALVVEPDPSAFYYALYYNPQLAAALKDSRITFAIDCDTPSLKKHLLQFADRYSIKLVTVIPSPAYTKKYSAALNTLDDLIQTQRNKQKAEVYTILAQGALWKFNSLQNLQYLPHSHRFWSFNGKLMNIPAVIVSSGPSLDKNVAGLKRANGKVLIISAYTALPVLQKHGITPHLVVAVDTRQLLRETPEEMSTPLDIPLLYVLSTDSRLLAKAKNAHKIFGLRAEDRPLKKIYNKLGHQECELFTSGSVAMSATDFAAISGCNPIIFMGQDLAFTNQKGHAGGISEGLTTHLEDKLANSFQVDAVDGGKVLTDVSLNLYRHTLEEYIHYDSRTYGRQFIDATEGGAKIHGTKIMTIEAALLQSTAHIKPNTATSLLNNAFKGNSLVFDSDEAHSLEELIESEDKNVLDNKAIRRLAERIFEIRRKDITLLEIANLPLILADVIPSDVTLIDEMLADALELRNAMKNCTEHGFGFYYQYACSWFDYFYGLEYANGSFIPSASADIRFVAKYIIIAYRLVKMLVAPPKLIF